MPLVLLGVIVLTGFLLHLVADDAVETLCAVLVVIAVGLLTGSTVAVLIAGVLVGLTLVGRRRLQRV